MNNTTDWIEQKLEVLISTQKPQKPTLKTLIFSKLEPIEKALANGYSYEEIAFRIHEASKETFPDSSDKWITIAVSTLRKYVYLARLEKKDVQPTHQKRTLNHVSTNRGENNLFG